MSSGCIALWSIEVTVSEEIGLSASSTLGFPPCSLSVVVQNGGCTKKASGADQTETLQAQLL